MSFGRFVFKNGPEYLTRGTVLLLVVFLRFLLQRFVSRRFLVLLWYSSYFFFHLCLFDGVSFQYFKIQIIFFSASVLILSWFCNSIPSTISLFPIFHYQHGRFLLVIPNFNPISWLYIFIVCIRVSSYFSLSTDTFIPSIYIKVVNIFL